MGQLSTENKTWFISCNEYGLVKIENKIESKKSFALQLFKNNYHDLYISWDVVPNLYLSPDSEYIIITYGVGYIYFIRIREKKVVKSFRLFSDISYEDDSYQLIDLCCYYQESTEIIFSNTGRYCAIRVRGDYDPQEGDGRKNLFTPVYFRSIFIIDLYQLRLCFQDDYSDVPENGGRNMAAIAFSPSDHYLVTGALGNIVKVFNLSEGICLGKFSSLVWINDPCGIRDCPLILFLNEHNFIYVNKENNLIRITMQKNHLFKETGIIRTGIPEDHKFSAGICDKWTYIYKMTLEQNDVVCYTDGNRKEYKQPLKFKLDFDSD